MGAQEEGVEQERGRKKKNKSMREWRVGGAKGKPGAGEARCWSRDQPGQGPRAESREGGAMVEKALMTPWGLLTEMEPMEEEPRMELSRRRARATSEVRRAKAEQKAQATEVETGIQ